MPWQSSPLEAALAGGTEAPASVTARRRALWGSEGTWGVETHTKRTFPSLIKVLPLTRIRDWPIVTILRFSYVDTLAVSVKPNK